MRPVTDQKPLEGEGPRPTNPHVAIVWAARRGQGLHLTFDEVWELRMDGAIETRAVNVVMGDCCDRCGKRGGGYCCECN